MTITWLGQAGLMFQTGDTRILIDPYLSDNVGLLDPAKRRRAAVKEELFDLAPDGIIFTHNHPDHYDPETAEKFLSKGKEMLILAPQSVWSEVRKNGGNHNYVLFNRHTSWTEFGLRFTAVKAEHSDAAAIGVIIDNGEKKYYITGDTLYNEEIFEDLPTDIYAVFLPVNGVGNNMNMTDAKRFCERIRPNVAVPMHCGLFDSLDMNRFDYRKKAVPIIYKEIPV